MTFYLHWVNESATTWSASYAVSDEEVLSLRIDHEEGQIPSMEVQVRNPKIGLLNPGRKIWAWMSWNGNGHVEPLFFGRLVGIPTDLLAEAVTLQFTAKPKNFAINKQIAAENLKVRPYYDPVFIDMMKRDDPDAILEGYSALWHIDRVTHAITPSDVLFGEDGTAIFPATEIPYDSVQVSLNQIPLSAVAVDASVSWSQEFNGYIDAGTGIVKTYSGDGIMSDWPKAASVLGSGWTVTSSFIKDLNKIETVQPIDFSTNWQNNETEHNTGDTMSVSVSQSYPNFQPGTDVYEKEITRREVIGVIDPRAKDMDGDPAPRNTPSSLEWTKTIVPKWRIKYGLNLRYDAERSRTERIQFIMQADTQAILSDPDLKQETEDLSLTGADVGQPIIDFKNWTSVAGKYVDLGDFIFPDDPLVPGQKSLQVCVRAGVAGMTIPTFSNVAGVTTNDGSVTWSSLGYTTGIYNISQDWDRYVDTPVGTIILPVKPFTVLYKDYVQSGRMQEPETGVAVPQYLIVEVPGTGFFQCTLSGITDKKNPSWKTSGVTKDGTVEWTFVGYNLPTGYDYYICTQAGTTGEVLPLFGEGTSQVTDANVVWTRIPSVEVPLGGYPGNTPRNDYFPTDRGCWSLEYLMCLARARLRLRSRAVEIAFESRFEKVSKLSCRMNAMIYDRRLPGGVAAGKVVGYSLFADGDQKHIIGRVRIGCAVGNGSALTVSAGDPTYVETGYVTTGYQVYENQVVTPINNEDIGYTPPASNVDDPFVYPLTPDQVFLNGGFVVRGDIDKQEAAIEKALQKAWVAANYTPDNIDSIDDSLLAQQLGMSASTNSVQALLQQNPIWLELELLPVSGKAYENFYSITTSTLILPKMIDLSASAIPDEDDPPEPDTTGSVLYATASFKGVANRTVTSSIPLQNTGTTLIGAGTMTVRMSGMRVAKASASAVASMGAFGVLMLPTRQRLSGSGGMTTVAKAFKVAAGQTDGNGTLVSRARIVNGTNPASANGNGTLVARARVISRDNRAAFNGSGVLSVVESTRLRATAAFAGSGTLDYGGEGFWSGYAGFAAAGGMEVSIEVLRPSQTALDGAGGMSADTSVEQAGQAALDGAGDAGTQGVLEQPGEASLSGDGVMSTIPGAEVAYASFAGDGSMGTDATFALGGTAILDGSGGMALDTNKVYAASASFGGEGTLVQRPSNRRLLEGGTSSRLLEDGASTRLLE